MENLKLLALSGSLRQFSYNTSAIEALRILAPKHVEITIANISNLPLFNPDREHEYIPACTKLKLAIKESAGLIIASPEYAHGISSPMKNALDWLVSGEEFPYKPIMLINTSPRASHGQAALKEVLNTMSANIIESAYVSTPLLGSRLNADGIVKSQKISQHLITGLNEFCHALKTLKVNH